MVNEDDSNDETALEEIGNVNLDGEKDSEIHNDDEGDHDLNNDESIIEGPATRFKEKNSKMKKPKNNSYIKFKLGENWSRGRVMSIQPRRTGVNKDWVNMIIEGENSARGVNWNKVTKWEIIPFPETTLYLCSIMESSQDVVNAKEKELQNMIDHDVFEEVENIGQKTISSKWVLTEKFKGGKKLIKARLVARGFEEDSTKLRTDSPTCNKRSFRMLMTMAVSYGWKIHSLDISAAFLQGDPLKREVFLKMPKDICDKGKLWRLKRCIYGLNDAPRSWYERVKKEFLNLGAIMSVYDPALFFWYKNNRLIGVLTSHVDDFAYCGTTDYLEGVVNKVKCTFKISSEENGSFKYLGLNVLQNDDNISIDQQGYVDSLQPVPIDRKRKSEDILLKEEITQLRGISGQLNWITSQTRPDSAFHSCEVANYGKDTTIKQLKDANKAIRHIQNTHLKLKFNKMNMKNVQVVCFTDATHASLSCGSSQGAYIIFLQDVDKRNLSPIDWQSKKLCRVTKSPLASETLALAEGADASYLIATMLKEMLQLENIPKIKCFTDNKSLYETVKTTNSTKDLRLRVEIARLRQMVEKCEIEVNWIDGKYQLADCLTKKGASSHKLIDVLESSYLPQHN